MRMRVVVMAVLVLPVLSGCGLVLDQLTGGERDEGPQAPVPSAPVGWRALGGGKYGYIVRQEWKPRPPTGIGEGTLYEDAAGQWRMQVEEFTGCGNPNRPEELSSFSRRVDPKDSLQTYTNRNPPRRFTVPGAAGAWRYDLAGSSGGDYTVFNVWVGSKRSPCWSELWMTVRDDRAGAEAIAAHFTAAPPP
jgi:hypothetical protein